MTFIDFASPNATEKLGFFAFLLNLQGPQLNIVLLNENNNLIHCP